jgi:hypothetical protein
MNDRDFDQILDAWLELGPSVAPDRVGAAARLEARRSRQSPRRFLTMSSNTVRYGLAAAAVVLVAIVGVNLLPPGGNSGGDASPSPTIQPTPASSPPLLPSGTLQAGRYALHQDGVDFTIEIPDAGWTSTGIRCPTCDFADSASLDKVEGGHVWIGIWSVDGTYADPCGGNAGPVADSVADLAADVASLPNLEVTGPTDVTVGGMPAKYLVVTVPDDIGCDPGEYNLWYDAGGCSGDDLCGRYVSNLGSTIRVWIVDVGGESIWLDAETPAEGVSEDLEREIQHVIASVEFE